MNDKRLARRVTAAVLWCLAAGLVASATAQAASSPPANDQRGKAAQLKAVPEPRPARRGRLGLPAGGRAAEAVAVRDLEHERQGALRLRDASASQAARDV